MAKLAFLGLGVMGVPMAGHLVAKGHSVTVDNRNPAKTKLWVETYRQTYAPTPVLAAQGAEVVMACVGNDDDLRAVCLGENGAFAGMNAGAIFVDHTTVSAEVTRELGVLAATQGIGFIDAPLSGGQAGAQNGVLSIMCGGLSEDYAKVEPIMQSYARICRLLGGPGSG